MEDLFTILRREYHFKVDSTTDIKDRIRAGMTLIVNLTDGTYHKYDGMDRAVLSAKPVRQAGDVPGNSMDKENTKIEAIVNSVYFRK